MRLRGPVRSVTVGRSVDGHLVWIVRTLQADKFDGAVEFHVACAENTRRLDRVHISLNQVRGLGFCSVARSYAKPVSAFANAL